ncbi:MAG: DNA polymerase I [Firmicutes bacterium]|nr:DNA polymerase I [Bacillota bacterium]
MSKPKLIIIDTFSLANRAFFALPPLGTSDGQPTNAVYGMAMMLLRLLDETKPDYMLAALDTGLPTFRHREYPEYKGQRLKMEDSLRTQIPIIKELLGILEIPALEEPGFEADDLIGTYAKGAAKQGLEVELVTGDRDAFQLVEPGIKVKYTRKGITEVDLVDCEYIQNRYQLAPEQLIDLKGLMGDSSDNIPGVPGFGEKTALKYLHQFGSLDGIYESVTKIERNRDRELLIKYRDQAYLSKKLATIITDLKPAINIEECCRKNTYDRQKVLDFCIKYEFKSLAKKLADAGNQPEVELNSLPQLDFSIGVIKEADLEQVTHQLESAGVCVVQFLTAGANWTGSKLLGLGLSDLNQNWFYPLSNSKTLPESLIRVLNDGAIAKIGHDLKKQMQIAKVNGVEIRGNLDDTLIAGYLVNAGLGSLELEELAKNYLHKTIPVWTSERGKSRSVLELPAELSEAVLTKITGGRLQAIRELRGTFQDNMATLGLANLYQDVEAPLINILFTMEETGVKVDPEVLRTFGNELRSRQHQLETEIYDLTGSEFNINSPKQLGVILFEKLGLKAPKKTKTGYSTDAQVLEVLIDEHPVVALILEYRQNIKLQTTYIDSLIALINPKTGRVHTTFNQAVTTTGRLSSTEPNLQNIPVRSEEGRMIRKAFVPKDSEHLLLAADYSQIELRVMAHFSGDGAFREAFLKGEDIHRFTAAAVNGVEPEQVTGEMRDQAKAVNFGIIYGISGFGLAKNIGVTRKQAESFIEAYFNQYPGVEKYVNELIEQARGSGEVHTMLGRIRKLPDLYSRNFTLRSFAERMARNTPIQGTAADIIKLAMVKIGRILADRPELGQLLLQVHDELVFEVREANWRELANIVKKEMEQAVTLNVPLVVDFKIGSNWGEMSSCKLEELNA